METKRKKKAEAYPFGTDAVLNISLFLPNRPPAEIKIRVSDISGRILKSDCTPERIEEILREGLERRLGRL